MQIKNIVKRILSPGSDIFTRRRTYLEKYWKKGERTVLDAGFGNGWFSYRAYLSGATVKAMAIQPELLPKAHGYYNKYLKISEEKLNFSIANLYDLNNCEFRFDEIICYETLEHIKDDVRVCESFFNVLNDGGVLHLCCPNSEHPRWAAEELDQNEGGGHVRYGYTQEDYKNLLEPIGFHLDEFEGVGGPVLVTIQEKVQTLARKCFGEVGAMIIAMLSTPLIRIDNKNPKVPFSIYVRATKPVSDIE